MAQTSLAMAGNYQPVTEGCIGCAWTKSIAIWRTPAAQFAADQPVWVNLLKKKTECSLNENLQLHFFCDQIKFFLKL